MRKSQVWERSFVSHAYTNELIRQLEDMDLEDVKKAIKAQRRLSSDEFSKLLLRRCFYAAIQYERLEFGSLTQHLITDAASFDVVLQLLSDPVDVEYGLYFLQRIQKRNLSATMFSQAVRSLHTLIANRTLSYCKNPILVCILALEFLTKAKAICSRSELSHYEKQAKFWTEVCIAIDKKLSRKYAKDLVFLYLSTDLRGRGLVTLLMNTHRDELVLLKGLETYVEYGWDGPYRYCYHLMMYSSLFGFLVKEEESERRCSSVFILSFKSWVMRPSLRFMLSLVVCTAITLSLQFKFLEKLEEMGDYMTSGTQREKIDQALIIMKDSYDFIGYSIFTFSCTAYYLHMLIYCLLQGIRPPLMDPLALSALLAGLGASKYQLAVYSDIYDAEEMMNELGVWVSVWMIGLWLHIIFQLEFTERFGVIVKSMKDMVVKTLGFFLLLSIIIYAYASVFLMRNFRQAPPADSISHSFYFFYNMMLGAYEPEEYYAWEDAWNVPMFYSYTIVTIIVLMNLLIAILSHLYEQSYGRMRLEYRQILTEHVSVNIVSPKYRLLNCSVPPLSCLALPFLLFMFTPWASKVSKLVLQGIYIACILPWVLVLFLVMSGLVALPAYLFHFVAILRSRAVKVETFEGDGEMSPQTKGNVCCKALGWLLLGPFVITYTIFKDTFYLAGDLTDDVEPGILAKEKVWVDFSAAHTRDSRNSPENSSILPKPTFQESISHDNKDQTDSFSARFRVRLSDNPLVDRELVSRVCQFTRHLATPWVAVREMERRFFTALEFVDVALITAAINKTAQTRGDDSKRILKTMLMIGSLLRAHKPEPSSLADT